jgi:hypothetical protein
LKSISSDSGAAGVPHPLFLDIQTLETLTGYAHWIPVTRGLYEEYFHRNFPGWQWNQIVPVLIQRKVLIVNSGARSYRALSQGLYISTEIQGISISIEDGRTKIQIQKVKVEKNVSHK